MFCKCFRPCPPEVQPIDSYAQYSVTANPPSGSSIPMGTMFQEGDAVTLQDETKIILKPGYLYLVNYLFLSTPEPDGYMQILPKINGRPGLLYSFYAPSGTGRNASASGSFTLKASDTEENTLSFGLTYSETTKNIDISGEISVTPLLRL